MKEIKVKDTQSENAKPTNVVEFPANHRLMRIRAVIEMTGISKSYVYQLVRDNEFPKPVKLTKGAKAVAWVEAEVQAWVNSRIADRNMDVA